MTRVLEFESTLARWTPAGDLKRLEIGTTKQAKRAARAGRIAGMWEL